MSKREKQAYRKGQIDTVKTIISIVAWTGIIIAMLIKAEIFVM